MARNVKYVFKGLDKRTNDLYRKEGSASDCRNVRLDANRRLIKREDMDEIVVPREVSGASGEFLTKVPNHAKIIAVMPYEDHKVIITSQKTSDIVAFQYVNKYYKWNEVANTLTSIPTGTYSQVFDTSIGPHINKEDLNFIGRVQYKNQEGVLFFKGSVVTGNTITDGSVSIEDASQNRTRLFKYDGKSVTLVGVYPQHLEEYPFDSGTATLYDYLRYVSFSLDNKNRYTFSNYTSGNTNTAGGGISAGVNLTTDIPNSYIYYGAESAYFKMSENKLLDTTGSISDRTSLVTIHKTSNGVSAYKGQYLYNIVESYDSYTPPLSTVPNYFKTSYKIYRFKIEDINYSAGAGGLDYYDASVVLNNFEEYGQLSYGFEPVDTMRLNSYGGMGSGFCGNTITAVYGSSNFTYGYDFKGVTIIGKPDLSLSELTLKYASSKQISGMGDTHYPPFDFITTRFEDMYDENTVKLPPPKSTSFVPYLGSFVMTDEDNLYFSDFSVGGNIEDFTPFDTFKVGSSEYGKITGVFANETFLAVLREREAYYITGNIFTGNYRVQSYKSTRIGCDSPLSITPFKGAGLFVSAKGVYVCAQGGRMEELSDIIDPIFSANSLGLQLDTKTAKTVVDFNKEILIIDFYSKKDSITSYQLVFSYYHREWFIYEGIPTRGCFEFIENRIYTSDGINIFKEGTTSTKAIAYYISNFDTIQYPSLDKRFIKMWISTISMGQDFELGIKSYKNWDTSTLITDEVDSGDSSTTEIIQKLNQGSRSKSVAMELYSDSGNPMIIDGYEFTVEGVSKEFKDEVG